MTNLVHQIFLYLSRKIKLEHLSAGIYLTGGAAKLKCIDELIEQLTQMPCIVCKPDISRFRGLVTKLNEPEYSTVVGIFLYVLDNEIKKGIGGTPPIIPDEKFWKKLGRVIKKMFFF
jgi:cell division ATPase FtsA